MTVTLNLKSDLEGRVARNAAAQGVGVSDYLEDILEETVPQGQTATDPQTTPRSQGALQAYRAWRKTNQTDDPAEIEKRRLEWQEMKTALDEDRLSNRKLFP